MTTSEWTLAVALTASCCAGQTETSPTTQPQPGQPPVVAGEAFAAIDVEEAGRRLWPKPGPTAYGPASPAEAAALTELIARMWSATEPADLTEMARAAGYTVEGWTIDGQRYLAALELPEHRHGGGAYVLKVGETSAVILQAPHAFYDIGTERIALAMFVEQRGWPRALFVNTIHRYIGIDGVKRKQDDSPADPCHNAGHLFTAATTAAVQQLANAEVVQLHGFGDDDGAEPGGPAFAAIVSGGDRVATPRARAVAERLRSELGVAVALYPEDTDRLGATTNVQGRAIRADNERRGAATTFVHIEMGGELRRRLRDEAELRGRLAAALRPPASAS